MKNKRSRRRSRRFGPFSKKRGSLKKIGMPYNVEKFDEGKFIPFIPSDYIPLDSYIKPISFQRKRSFGNLNKVKEIYGDNYDIGDKKRCNILSEKYIHRKNGTTLKDFINEFPAASRCTSLWPFNQYSNDPDYGMLKLSSL